MSLFRLVAKLGIDSTEFNAGLKKAESGVSSSMAAIGARVAAAFSVTAIAAFAAKVASAAGEIADLADQLGITTEEVQKLQRAAERSGVSFDKYAATLAKIRKLKADAAGGDASAQAKFSKAGLNSNDSDFSLLQQIGGLPDAQAFEILDAKSAKLKNSLSQINDIPKIELMTDENVQALDRAGDSLGDMWRTLKAMASVPLGSTARAILDGSWVANNRTWKRDGPLAIPTGRFKGRDSGEFMGPSDGFAAIQAERNARADQGQQFSTMDDLARLQSRKFSPISMGDRANVGGFFGPNADLNQKMTRLAADVSKIATSTAKTAEALTPTQ